MPAPQTPRVVLDTNTLLRGLLSADSSAAKVRRATEMRRILPLLSKPVLDEYRAVLLDPELTARFPTLTPLLVDVAIRRLRFIGDYSRAPGVHFAFPRDPLDQKFLELAIALRASHIVTSDEDLLSLPTSRSDPGRRFRQRLPNTAVLTAADFVARHSELFDNHPRTTNN